jgi:hypothetical protein
MFWLDYTYVRTVYYGSQVVLEAGDKKQIPRGELRLQLIHHPSADEPGANASAFIIP